MKYFILVILIALCFRGSSQRRIDTAKIVPQWNPLKHKTEYIHKDSLKSRVDRIKVARVANSDSTFIGLFYYYTSAKQFFYALYLVGQTYVRVHIQPSSMPVPYQVFNVVTDSAIVDPDLATKQLIRIKP